LPVFGALLLALIGFGLVGHLGGQIRHTELNSPPPAASGEKPATAND